ncbi:hypothetical protein SAMD00019534_086010 [Acytostelium subglobosum LB1]|uniref:hypothetical protein n=1 Tax=Acytostelium subglobosum LB1 TaxID=1410327 RepID=UPI00064520B0|nr:hypothetical protein SAMD00019534_086010 [Acytostelium subglobosum LB1]GAM25426.1 hypothetical protein SAMD00019534_086010 [Acytostelium subglobosum LB1]|eukprot:XP_012751412.1 hypothetical protein SAMD00019534_086010 [Acytostelium subglobosum LB1]
MNCTILEAILSKLTSSAVTLPADCATKPSKLFEIDSIKSTLPQDNSRLDSTLKQLDAYFDLSQKEEDAKKRDVQLHKINKELVSSVFIYGSTLTAFDAIYYVLLHPWMTKLNDKERFIFCNITRWFNFVQNTTFLNNGHLNLVPISLTPPPAEPPKKQAAGTAATSTDKKEEKKDEKKDAAPAAEKKKGSGREKVVEAPKPEDVSRFEIRVGKIVEVARHESADQLYVEKIDLAEPTGPRTIASGLVKFVPIEEMKDRVVLVLCNLKPRNLKGVKSEGMVLCAGNADHTQVELIDVPAGAKLGERVTFTEFPGEHDKVLKPEIVDIVLKDLKTNGELVATYKGCPFTTSAGPCIAKSLSNSSIS